MKKNLFTLLLFACFLGTNASVYAVQLESEDSSAPAIADILAAAAVSAPDFEYTIQAVDGASVMVPVNTPYLNVISTPWMLGAKEGNVVRYVFYYDEWVRGGKPDVFDGFIMGKDNKKYTVRIHIL